MLPSINSPFTIPGNQITTENLKIQTNKGKLTVVPNKYIFLLAFVPRKLVEFKLAIKRLNDTQLI